MKQIYIDISEMVRLSYISGIQRVVIEILKEWLQTIPDSISIMTFDYPRKEYRILDARWFLSAAGNPKQMKKRWLHYTDRKKIEDFSKEDIFFDLDSAWISPLKRSWLLPKLKAQGAKIAVNIYDIIPVTHPKYCHEHNVLSFLEYLGAHLSYADLMIANAQATIDAIKALTEETGSLIPETAVVPLGCDFSRGVGAGSSGKPKRSEEDDAAGVDYRRAHRIEDDTVSRIRGNIRRIPEKGKYILMVGTIEPRKNHAYVLDAFDRTLFAQGVNLVFAGRIGWNMTDFTERIQSHPQQGKQFYHIPDGNDEEIAFLYESAYAVAFSSMDEGFGLPIIEAFLHGTPVLASDIPVLREVGGNRCVYFDVSDENSLSEQTLQLLSDQEYYQRLKEQVEDYRPYTWEESATKMREVLNI